MYNLKFIIQPCFSKKVKDSACVNAVKQRLDIITFIIFFSNVTEFHTVKQDMLDRVVTVTAETEGFFFPQKQEFMC